MSMQQRYRLVGRGSDLGIEVQGGDEPACMQAAISGFGAFIAEVDETAARQRIAVEVSGASPAERLHALVDEAIWRLDAEGVLAIGLVDPVVEGEVLRGMLEVVSLGAVRVHGTPPKAATWHELRLEAGAEGWRGHVMLDL